MACGLLKWRVLSDQLKPARPVDLHYAGYWFVATGSIHAAVLTVLRWLTVFAHGSPRYSPHLGTLIPMGFLCKLAVRR